MIQPRCTLRPDAGLRDRISFHHVGPRVMRMLLAADLATAGDRYEGTERSTPVPTVYMHDDEKGKF